ncbi:hypothetical protein [Herbiconiux flava]|uniref:Uncharacterized protein n=1 Tax=Herbiconiux flava TaxID=881268 RepID=A0A852SLM5_9MICO|nr:hypothetical protein [Herbiconiux flava]NYD69109.1 hypothetical protein [Herbiconiux flava]GLK15857.1 hypothetical protein GCM10017602_03390 [Herbiconiux flava]
MPNPDSRPRAAAPTTATSGTEHTPPLTRRQLRELEQQAAAEQSGVEPVSTVPVAPAIVEPPLSRRSRRALDSHAGARDAAVVDAERRETELRDAEIADIEVAPLGSGVLEPDVELALEPVRPADSADDSLAPEVPLHAPASRRARRAAEAPRTEIVSTGTIAVVVPSSTTPSTAEVDRAGLDELEAAAALVTTGPIAVVSRRAAREAAVPAKGAASRRAARGTGRRIAEARPGSARQGGTRAEGARSASARRRGWAKAGLSAIAMAFVVGMTAVTAIPTTVSASPVDSNLVNLSLTAESTAETQQLITANGSTAEVVDRDGYSVSDAGELQAAGYSSAQMLVGRSLAQELVDAMDSGKLVGSVPDHMKEIRWIAQGVTVPDCGVDYRILEIIAIAVRNFDQVGVSDINRKCTGQIEGAGTSSSHYIDGGGHAVDFYLLDNKSLNGADAGTLKLIGILDPVMPVGARVGQAGCRASAGVTVNLTNWTEFDDSCTHMHVDVPVTDAPLLLAQ